MNNSWAMYALMAADAYNVRNAAGNDIADLGDTIQELFGYEQRALGPNSGIVSGVNQWGEKDSATYSHSSGLNWLSCWPVQCVQSA